MADRRRLKVGLQGGGQRLLALEHDAVVTAPGLRLQQAHPDECADAAHPDHAAGDVGELVPAQQDALVVGHAGSVGLAGLPCLFHLVLCRFEAVWTGSAARSRAFLPDWPGQVRALGGIKDGGRLATITSDPPDPGRGIEVRQVDIAPDGPRLARLG